MGIRVKDSSLPVIEKKALMLALTVHVYQTLRKGAQVLTGEHLSLDMDEGPSAVRLDRTPDVKRSVFRLNPSL